MTHSSRREFLIRAGAIAGSELMTVRMFAWRAPDPVEAIDRLEPYDVVEIPRRG